MKKHLSILFVVFVLHLQLFGVLVGAESVSSLPSHVFILTTGEAQQVEMYDSGEWVGLMPQALGLIGQEVGITFDYVTVGGGDFATTVNDSKIELVSAVNPEQDAEIITALGLRLSEPIFTYDTYTYHLGFTQYASDELITSLNTQILNISESDIAVGIINDAEMDMTTLPMVVYVAFGLSFVLLLIFAIMSGVYRSKYIKAIKKKKTKSENSKYITKRKFLEIVNTMIDDKSDSLLTYVLIEVDNTAIKNYFGEDKGNEVVTDIGRIIEARLEQDEFMCPQNPSTFLLAINADSEEKAKQQLKKIVKFVSNEISEEYRTHNVRMFASACPPNDMGCGLDDLVWSLEQIMERARADGVALSVSNKEAIKQMIDLRRMGRQLLDTPDYRDFVFHLLPCIKTEGVAISGAQALVRWEHPTMGLLTPNTFLPYFQNSGSIAELNYQILTKMCNWVGGSEKVAKSSENPIFTCHMSHENIRDKKFIARIEDILMSSKVSSKNIGVEFDAELLVDKSDIVLKNLHYLRDKNIEIVLDDFGGMNTFFASLYEYPIKKIKLDNALSKNIDNPKNETIIAGITDIAHSLGIEVHCEQIEQKEQLDKLQRLGVDFMSGYLFYRPMLPVEFERIFYHII